MPIRLLNRANTPKKENLILLGMSSNLIFAGACAIQDLKRINLDLSCDIMLITDKISSEDLRILSERFQCSVGIYKPPFSGLSFYLSRCVRIFTPVVFSKYECFHLLKEYKKVIWMDYDIVITQRLDELLRDTVSGVKALKSPQSLDDCFYTTINEPYFQEFGIGTGLMVFDEKLSHPEIIYDECLKLTRQFINELYLPEQGVLNMVFGKIGINIEWLDMENYAAHPSDVHRLPDLGNVKILHSFGTPKFWDGLDNAQWMDNYNNWISLGGSKYRPPKTKTKIFLYRVYDNLTKVISKIQTLIQKILPPKVV